MKKIRDLTRNKKIEKRKKNLTGNGKYRDNKMNQPLKQVI